MSFLSSLVITHFLLFGRHFSPSTLLVDGIIGQLACFLSFSNSPLVVVRCILGLGWNRIIVVLIVPGQALGVGHVLLQLCSLLRLEQLAPVSCSVVTARTQTRDCVGIQVGRFSRFPFHFVKEFTTFNLILSPTSCLLVSLRIIVFTFELNLLS